MCLQLDLFSWPMRDGLSPHETHQKHQKHEKDWEKLRISSQTVSLLARPPGAASGVFCTICYGPIVGPRVPPVVTSLRRTLDIHSRLPSLLSTLSCASGIEPKDAACTHRFPHD